MGIYTIIPDRKLIKPTKPQGLGRFEQVFSKGSLISVESVNKIWMGNHRQVILYQAKASLHTPHHDLKQYWMKYGSFYPRFDERG